MVSSMERLPVEIFEIIAAHLDLSAYEQLRLCSRHLYMLSSTSFAKQYFPKLTTSLGSHSLDRLVNISRHHYLSTIVTQLDIKLLNHRDYKLLAKISQVGIFPPPKRFPVVARVKPAHIKEEATLYQDVFSRKFPECVVARLVRALQSFGNLKTIRFRTHHHDPLGWKSSEVPEGDQLFRTKCFEAVFDAIIKSEIQLEEFSMAKRKRITKLSRCADLPYPTLRLPLQLLPSLQHCFVRLDTLTLSIVSAHNGDSRVPGWENNLSQLVSCAPNLRNLALSLDRSGRISHYTAAIMHSLALSCRLKTLKSFHLVGCSIHSKDMAVFVQAHAETLSRLIFININLLTGSWMSVWASFKNIHGLQYLRLASLEGPRNPITFGPRDKRGPKTTLDVHKSEQSMCDMLDELIALPKSESELHMSDYEAHDY